MVATTELGLAPAVADDNDSDKFNVFSSLRDGAGGEDFSAGIDEEVVDRADQFDLVAVAGGEAKLDTDADIDPEKSANKTESSRGSAVCAGMASAACLSCAARGDCPILRMWGATESRQPDPERQSYVEELLSDDNNLVVAGYADSREQKDSLDSEKDYSSEQANNAEVTVNTENTTSEPESSFKKSLVDDDHKESSVKPTAFFDEAESVEKSKKPEEPEQPRMEAARDNPKEQVDENKQPLSVKHEMSVHDNANPSDDIVETETLASEEKYAAQEMPVAIAPETAPAVVSAAPKPDRPERVDKSPVANHSQESQSDLSKKMSTELTEDKSHDLLAATEITTAVAGLSTENPAPVQKTSDSKVIKSMESEQKAQSQNLESLETTVDDVSGVPVAASNLNAKNNARLENKPIELNSLAGTRQHDKLDVLDTAAATDTITDTDIDRSTLSRAAVGPEKSAGVTSTTNNHSTPQAEDKPSISPSSSPRANNYENEAPTPSNPLQKDIEKESAGLDDGSFVSPAKIGDLAGTMSAADESASSIEQRSNLEQQPAIDNELNAAEISTVVKLAKSTKHSENISPTEQPANDVLDTTDKEAISVEPAPEYDAPLGKSAAGKADFISSHDIGEADNTKAATYSAVEVKSVVDNNTAKPQEVTANWVNEDEIFVIKQSQEMPHFADDEMSAVDPISDLSLPSELPPDPEVNMRSDLASVKLENLAKSEVTEPDMKLSAPIDQLDYKGDEMEESWRTTALPNESETIYIDLRNGYAVGEDSATKTPIVASQTTIKSEADLPVLLEIADDKCDDIVVKNTLTDNVIAGNVVVKDVAADNFIVNDIASGTPDFEQNNELLTNFSEQKELTEAGDLARQFAINGDLKNAHKIALTHPLLGLWADDSQANPEEEAPARSSIGVTTWLAQLVGAVAVYVTCSRRVSDITRRIHIDRKCTLRVYWL